MIELLDQDRQEDGRRSSKGNQWKWRKDNTWYKADYMGYEGLAEYVVSHLLLYSNLKEEQFVLYDTEEIRYGVQRILGCRSQNFLPEKSQLITAERLFHQYFGESLYQSIFRIREEEERLLFLVNQIERITGLVGFGRNLSVWMTIDAFFLNEDRHTHNLAVILDERERFHVCPAFDHGAALLSDIRMDYPLEGNLYEMMERVPAKTFSNSFDKQLDVAERLYGRNLRFSFGKKTVEEILKEEPYYPMEVKERIRDILFEQMRRYAYLFE